MMKLSRLTLLLFIFYQLLVSAAAETPSMLVSPNWLRDHLDEVTVIHAGFDQAEYATAHIPGAIYADWSDLTTTRGGVPNELPEREQLEKFWRRLGVPDKGKIVVYDGGKGLPAARAYVTFDWLGHGDRVAILDGGLKAWKKSGYAVTDAMPAVAEGNFRALSNDAILISTEELERVVTSRSSQVYDARPAAQYEGVEPGKGIERPGHIPGATNIFWEQHLDDMGMLKSPQELREMYSRAAQADTVVTYCRTGGQASHSYFVLRYLGFNPKLYDGSYYFWSRAGNPVERDGLIIYSSPHDFEQTRMRLLKVLEEKGLNIMAQVDHSANAKKAGKTLPPTRLFIFGNPKIGTDLMKRNRQIAIDLPQKILIWQDGGRVNLAYNSPEYLAQRHHLADESLVIDKLSTALRGILKETIGSH